MFFADPNALSIQDRIENGEYRWQTLGKIEGSLVLLVAHTIIDDHGDEIIRIISARKATSQEKRKYDQHYAFSY